MLNSILAVIVRSLHNIFTSIWIGGMVVMVISFLPVIHKEISDQQVQGRVITRLLIRQSRWVYMGMIVLFISGLLLSRQTGQSGLFNFGNVYSSTLSIKHILVMVVTIIAIIRSTIFKEAATSMNKAKKKASWILLLINTTLGIAILVLSSMNAVIG